MTIQNTLDLTEFFPLCLNFKVQLQYNIKATAHYLSKFVRMLAGFIFLKLVGFLD